MWAEMSRLFEGLYNRSSPEHVALVRFCIGLCLLPHFLQRHEYSGAKRLTHAQCQPIGVNMTAGTEHSFDIFEMVTVLKVRRT